MRKKKATISAVTLGVLAALALLVIAAITIGSFQQTGHTGPTGVTFGGLASAKQNVVCGQVIVSSNNNGITLMKDGVSYQPETLTQDTLRFDDYDAQMTLIIRQVQNGYNVFTSLYGSCKVEVKK